MPAQAKAVDAAMAAPVPEAPVAAGATFYQPPQAPAPGGQASGYGNDALESQRESIGAINDLMKARSGPGQMVKGGWQQGSRTTQHEGTMSDATLGKVTGTYDQQEGAQKSMAPIAQAIGHSEAQAAVDAAMYARGEMKHGQDVGAYDQRAVQQQQQQALAAANDIAGDPNATGLQGLVGKMKSSGVLSGIADSLTGAATGQQLAYDKISSDRSAARKGAAQGLRDKAAQLGQQLMARGADRAAQQKLTYNDYLKNLLMSQKTTYEAQGRGAELQNKLAEIERAKQGVIGGVEAARQGNQSLGEHYRPDQVVGGGGLSLKQKLELIKAKGDLSKDMAGSVKALAGEEGKKKEGRFMVVNGERIPVDPGITDQIYSEMTKQADGINSASAALKSVEDHSKGLGGARATVKSLLPSWTPNLISDAIGGEAANSLGQAVMTTTREQAKAGGSGALTGPEQEASEAKFRNPLTNGGAISQSRELLLQNKLDLIRKATGTGTKLWPSPSPRRRRRKPRN